MSTEAEIMIVDDDPLIRDMLIEAIEDFGYNAVACESADEALALLRTSEIKLALCDICMPEIDGVELLKKIRQIRPSTRIIMITGLNDMDIAKNCIKLGAHDYITKPFDIDYLKTSVLAEIIPML